MNGQSDKMTKYCSLWICLLALTAVLPTECRHLVTQEPETVSLTDDDDFDLEDALNDYYDNLLLDDLPEITLASATEKPEEEEKKFLEYDYLSDMGVSEPEVTEKKEFKVVVDGPSITMDDGNITWTVYNMTNSTIEDPVLQKANRESDPEEEGLIRSKRRRLETIMQQIMSLRGNESEVNGTVPDSKHYSTLREMYEQNIRRPPSDWAPSNTYTEKVQSFYPSCEIPRNTDEDLWSDSASMNLLFNITFPTTLTGMKVSIVTAKLRLYKLSQGNSSSAVGESQMGSVQSKVGKSILNVPSFDFLPGIEDDRQIRITVYWYTRSLRKHRAMKRKLLASQMFSIHGEEWIEFNIRAAVRTWRESGKNFGLVVTVEDDDGTLLPADQYLHAMNCIKWSANVRPLPSILMDAAKQYFTNRYSNESKDGNETETDEDQSLPSPYQPLLYPMVDLCTIEVPEAELKNMALYNTAKMAYDSQLLNMTQKINLSNVTHSFIVFKNEGIDLKNISRSLRVPEKKKPETKEKSESRGGFFQNVNLGSPSAGQNRNVLVPIMTKSELEMTDDSDLKFKNELLKMQSDGAGEAEKTEAPRMRHNKKQWESFQKQVINRVNLTEYN